MTFPTEHGSPHLSWILLKNWCHKNNTGRFIEPEAWVPFRFYHLAFFIILSRRAIWKHRDFLFTPHVRDVQPSAFHLYTELFYNDNDAHQVGIIYNDE